jgi:aspartate aminotransferase
MGLYGERVGAIHLFCGTQAAAAKAKGHLSRFQRGQISQPPVTGARLAATILSKPILFQKWVLDLQEMSGRMKGMRKALYDELVALGTPGQWNHIVSQVSSGALPLTSTRATRLIL